MNNYIVIEGNIGSGKTALAELLSVDMNARLILERFADNPFLPKFYVEAEKYAFPLELSFLAERYQQLKGQLVGQELFSDRTISDYLFQKCQLFAAVNLPPDEFLLFGNFFSLMQANLPKPDLIVYLHKDLPNLKKNINLRGRAYESSISDAYLQKLEDAYLNYFKQVQGIAILLIDSNQIDFVNRKSDYTYLQELTNHVYAPGIHRFG